MKPIPSFIYNLLKAKHEASLLKLSDIDTIQVRNIERTDGSTSLPIRIYLKNGKLLKRTITREALFRLGNSAGMIYVDSLDTSKFDASVSKTEQRDYLSNLLSSINIKELDLMEIDVIVNDKDTLTLRAKSGSLLYCGTVLVKRNK